MMAILVAFTANAQNILENASVDWNMNASTGWSIDANNGTNNAAAGNLSFSTAADGTETVMRVTSLSSDGTDLTAGITSSPITSLSAGDYNMKIRLRNAPGGGAEANSGAFELRAFIQDAGSWTNFNSTELDDMRFIWGAYKLGGISSVDASTVTWLSSSSIVDTDDEGDFVDTDEWVDIVVDFNIASELTNQELKLLVRIGSAHVSTDDAAFEIDYIEWRSGVSTDLNDEIAADNISVIGNTLYVTDVEVSTYKLYNLSGVLVTEGEVAGSSVVLDAPKGLYIVKVGTTTKKVMIK